MTSKQIELNGTTIVQLAHYPGENEPTHVLTLHAPLTLALAEFLKCKDLAFDVHDQPRKFEGKIGLTHELEDVEIKMPGFMGGVDPMRPTKVWKFRISRDTELALGLDFRAHFKGIAEQSILNDLLMQFNKEEFDFQIVSLQGELFPDAPVHDGSGTRVDMSAAESDDEPSEFEEDDTQGIEAAPLASVIQMGTRKKKDRKPRDPEAERKAQAAEGDKLAAREPEEEYAGVTH